MNCESCQAENPAGAAFCMACGSRLPISCGNCGTALPKQAAFCTSCGQPVAGPAGQAAGESSPAAAPIAAPADDRLRRYIPAELLAKLAAAAETGELLSERRRVTMLFCDVQGSTSAAEHLDPEEWADVMNGAFEHLIAPVYRYEGTLARLMGDAVLAFFGAPISHEDDPERAVLAGLEILRDIEPYRERVKREWDIDFDVRVGINTGLVVVGAMGSDLRVEYTAMGDAVNVAARMEQTAAPGTVQISGPTRQLVDRLFEFDDLGEIEVKGRDDAVPAHRVVRALQRPASVRGIEGLRSPLIGRADELRTLRDAFDSVCNGQGRVISVVSEAGLGKSRLVAELKERLEADGEIGRVNWQEGRSLSYETQTPFTPVRGILNGLAGLNGNEPADEAWRRIEGLVSRVLPDRTAEVAPFLAAMLSAELPPELVQRVSYLDPPRLRMEIFRATVELIEALAAERPLVLSFEDLHWTDSASIDLVLELLNVAEHSTLLLLLVFRPRRQEVSWQVHETAERDHPHLYTAINLAPLDDSDTRELVSSLLTVDGLTDSVRDLILSKSEGNPYFVEEVIRSLIDQELVLHQGDRWVATDAVADFAVPDTLSAVLTTRLDQLSPHPRSVAQAASVIGREFRYDELAAMLEDVGELEEALVDLQRRELVREVSRVPRRVFRFKHALVQEAAYETLLLKRRTELHAGIATFLERLQPERVEDIAGHLLKARQQDRALPFLVAAGERAAQAFALPEAIERMETALGLLDDESDADLLRRALETLGEARELSFDYTGASEAYARLRVEGERLDDSRIRVSGLNKLALLRGRYFDERDVALNDLVQSQAVAENASDGEGLVEACMFQCYLRTGYAEFDEVEYYMTEITRIGDELGMDEPTLFGMTHFANTLIYLTRFDEALEQADLTLKRAEELGNLKYQAQLLTLVIPLSHMRNGDMPAALAALDRGMEIAQRIGDRESEALASTLQGKVAMAQGAYEEALVLFRRTVAASDATGIPYLRALGLCVTGTCYQQIGGPMLERALEFHARTAEVMDLPTGNTLGAWLWAEVGHGALSSGDLDRAKSLFDRALNEKSAPMHVMRPLALQGRCGVALAEGRVDEARRWFDQLEEYVRSREMRDQYAPLALTGARVEALDGNHEQALVRLDECEQITKAAGMKRLQLEVCAHRARSLDALGRVDDASEARRAGEEAMDEISAGFRDDELRRAFLAGARDLLDTDSR